MVPAPLRQKTASVNSLSKDRLHIAAAKLATRDKYLALIHERYGPPPMWSRPQGFTTLIRIILEQQVSLASAASMFSRLKKNVNPLCPEAFLEFGADNLKKLGLTRQKTAYCLHLAESVLEKRIDLSSVARMSDDQAKAALVQLKGIGSWSADIYLLMALRRPDVWPSGDLALGMAVADLMKLKSVPDFAALEQLAEVWRPYRAVAARMLWQHYLAKRSRK